MLPTIRCSDHSSFSEKTSTCLCGCLPCGHHQLQSVFPLTTWPRPLTVSVTHYIVCVCVCVCVCVSEQSFSKHWQLEDESDRRVKGARRPTGEATVKTVISLLAHCPLLVQHIIGGECMCVCVCVCSVVTHHKRFVQAHRGFAIASQNSWRQCLTASSGYTGEPAVQKINKPCRIEN